MKATFITTIVVFLLIISFLGNYGYKKNAMLKSTRANLASTTIAYEMKIEALNKEKSDLENNYTAEKSRNDSFAENINKITDKVGDLEKLKKLDKELLEKYSKVYFLNEHYVPRKLIEIDSQYVLPEKVPQLFYSDALPFLRNMFDDAKKDGIDLRVVSSYRSFATQAAVKANHKVLYGSGANQFSADQGYSEHQLGTTLDLSTAKLGANFDDIDKDAAYAWLQKNAYRYGFILSYPKNNAYYIFEPWHWRFVGVRLAIDLYTDKKNFYDMDQKEIDTYLLHMFD